MFGNFPEYEDLEYSAIIGYVTVNGDCDDSTSVWAVPVKHQWHIEDAYIFDEPIRAILCGNKIPFVTSQHRIVG